MLQTATLMVLLRRRSISGVDVERQDGNVKPDCLFG